MKNSNIKYNLLLVSSDKETALYFPEIGNLIITDYKKIYINSERHFIMNETNFCKVQAPFNIAVFSSIVKNNRIIIKANKSLEEIWKKFLKE